MVGPLALSLNSADPELREWGAELCSGSSGVPLRSTEVTIQLTHEALHGPPAPELTSTELAYHGWRARRTAGGYFATLSVAGDPERRGPRRLATLLRVVAEAELGDIALAFHGAALVRDGGAWLFPGPRGAGKTTLARELPAATRLGDDHALVVRHAGGWTVHPTPFPGREGLRSEAAAAPLRAVALLGQATVSEATRVTPAEAVSRLIPLVVRAGRDHQRALDLVAQLCDEVPVLSLSRRLGDDPIDALAPALLEHAR